MTNADSPCRTSRIRPAIAALLILVLLSGSAQAAKFQILFVTGHDPHGHPWQSTTPVLANTLERTGRFDVDVACVSTPEQATDFAPDFDPYDAVVLYAHGLDWPQATFDRFESYLREGGNCVVVHNAVGQFPQWEPYRAVIGVGPGDKHYGIGLEFDPKKDAIARVPAGQGTERNGHGVQHEWVVETRDPRHPIMAGLPRAWLHAKDELYHGFRGKPEHLRHLRVLATAHSAKSTHGTGAHEPVIMVNRFGKGRMFHTTLGHALPAVSCVGFQTIFLRGTEWAASGRVTLTEVPADFPKPDRSSTAKHRIVFIGGADTHGPGAHDHRAGAAMLRQWIDEVADVGPIETELYLDRLPDDLDRLKGAAAVVLMWEGWGKHLFNAAEPEVLTAFDGLLRRGTGLVTLHAATAVGDDVERRFLRMTGGNKKQNYSTHPMVRNETLVGATPGHPILRGVSEMTFPEEEFYRRIRFDHAAGRITPILRAVSQGGSPEERVVAWTFESKAGARAYSCTGPHFHRSFADKDFKRLTINAILWTSRLAIPEGDVKTKESDR